MEFPWGYLMGVSTTLACVAMMSRQRTKLEARISDESAARKRLEASQAYQTGVAEGCRYRENEIRALRIRNAELERECDELREQLNSTSAFAHALATKGRSAILLHGTGTDH